MCEYWLEPFSPIVDTEVVVPVKFIRDPVVDFVEMSHGSAWLHAVYLIEYLVEIFAAETVGGVLHRLEHLFAKTGCFIYLPAWFYRGRKCLLPIF